VGIEEERNPETGAFWRR